METILAAIDILAETGFGEEDKPSPVDEIDYELLGSTKHCASQDEKEEEK